MALPIALGSPYQSRLNFRQCCGVLMLSSEIDLLMYSTFAVQSGKGARQQRLALALPYVLLWSIEGAIHLENCSSRNDPAAISRPGKDPEILWSIARRHSSNSPESVIGMSTCSVRQRHDRVGHDQFGLPRGRVDRTGESNGGGVDVIRRCHHARRNSESEARATPVLMSGTIFSLSAVISSRSTVYSSSSVVVPGGLK